MFCNHEIYGPIETIRDTSAVKKPSGSDDVKTLLNANTFCTYATLQGIFLRANTTNKVIFLFKLFKEIGTHNYMQVMFKIIQNYYAGKVSKYLFTLDQSNYINDIYMIDNDRTMESTEFVEYTYDIVKWFHYLDDPDLKMGIFLSLLTISGNSTIYRILALMKKYYKDGRVQQSVSMTSTINLQNLSEGYVEKLDESDPDAQAIIKKRKEWEDNLKSYKHKIQQSLASKTNGKKLSVVASKSKITAKPTVKSLPVIDYIQLMPIWIALKIFSYLDEDDLKNIKKVNQYWDFVSTYLSKEENARIYLDKWIESVKTEYQLNDITLNPKNVKPSYRFAPPANPISCHKKVYDSINKINTVKPFQISLLGAIANDESSYLCLPVVNLLPFERKVKAPMTGGPQDYLHIRPPCAHFDNTKIELLSIKDIPKVGDALRQSVENIKSFDFFPDDDFNEGAEGDSATGSVDKSTHVQFPVFVSTQFKNANNTLSTLMAKSIANYLAKITSSVMSKENRPRKKSTGN